MTPDLAFPLILGLLALAGVLGALLSRPTEVDVPIEAEVESWFEDTDWEWPSKERTEK